jgi:hypothetical protein
MRDETDLRSALRTLEEEAPDAATVLRHVSQADALSSGRSWLRRGLHPRFRPLAAAASAAAGVAAIVALSLAVASVPASHGPVPPAPAPKIPPYYLAVGPVSSRTGPFVATIRRTTTGKSVATIPPPRPYTGFGEVTAAADDRTFVIDAQTTGGYQNPSTVARLYLVRFNPAGNTVALSALPIPGLRPGSAEFGFALSPDGTQLAVGTLTGLVNPVSQIRLYSIATGAVLATWNAAGTADTLRMMWTSGGLLGIDWRSGQPGGTVRRGKGLVKLHNPADGLRLLNTRAGSGNLVADSTLAPCGLVAAYPYLSSGGRVITSLAVPVKAGQGDAGCSADANQTVQQTTSLLEEFSASTGRALGVVAGSVLHSAGDARYLVDWANASGSVIIVSNDLYLGVLSDGRLTKLGAPPEPGETLIGF